MSLTSAQELRLKIQDFPTLTDRQIVGDGTASSFLLGHRAITSGSAFVPSNGGATAWVSTGATFNESGMVSFARVIPNNSAVRLTYVRSVFSDAEIDQFWDRGGGLYGGAREAVESLMFDGLRRAEWQAPDGSSYDDTAAIALLKQMHDTFNDMLAKLSGAEGGIVEWSAEGWRHNTGWL